MSNASIRDRVKRNASGIAATTVTGTWLAALVLGFNWWLAALLFGYIVIVPVVAMLFDEEGDEGSERERASRDDDVTVDGDSTEATADALERLRNRYAAGDLSDEAFEEKLERLLETETIEDARAHVEQERAGAEARQTTESDAAGTTESDAAGTTESDAARDPERELDRAK